MKKFKLLFLLFNLTYSVAIAQLSQPEFSSFTPIGQTEMVDLATGDFSYNIPLMEIGGYPINIGYHSGISMEQEASMVGLGWNINVGAITRTMRGLPDDFKGDTITTITTFKPNWTLGVNLGSDMEIFGYPNLNKPPKKNATSTSSNNSTFDVSLSLGAYYNSYTGYGFEWVFSPSISAQNKNEATTYELGMGISKRSNDIAGTISSSLHIPSLHGLNIGTSSNSIDGLKSVSLPSTNKQLLDLFIDSGVATLLGGSETYTPSRRYQFNSSAYTYNQKVGLENAGIFSNFKTTLYYSRNELKNDSTSNAYGYLYLDESSTSDLLDMTRENDRGYIESCPNLSVPALMHDIYSATGQGVSGTFRAFRNDIGVLFDPIKNETSNSGALGADFGAGSGWKVGVNPKFNSSNTKYQKWENGNYVPFDFVSENINTPLYESVYFKNVGEKTIMSDELLNQLGGVHPVKIDLSFLGSTSTSLTKYDDNNNTTQLGNFNSTSNSERAKRGQVFSYLTAEEATIPGAVFNSQLEYVDENYWASNMTVINEPRVNPNRKNHHISHCEVINTDGMRYEYSLPVYNNVYQEVSFNVCGDDDGDGLVQIGENENSIENKSGVDWFYEKKSIPAYAHSYLLTSVLSQDYVDVTGDGISIDDLGQAVKFNYFKATDNYKWRFPYEEDKANFNGGFDSKGHDNKANYLYGEKELVYLQSIESKTQVAIYKYGDRHDSHEVKGENGGQGPQVMKKLISISLYTKRDLENDPNSAIPIKTVHFEYDYSLVYNHPSSNEELYIYVQNGPLQNGRLTLKNLAFTYNGIQKSKSENYHFDYNNEIGYNRKAVDRWGVLKVGDLNPVDLDNSEFPYVVQPKEPGDQIQATKDNYVGQWNLKTIETPSNARIEVMYESDDYAYVQNKKAMRMTPLGGVGQLNDTLLYEDNDNPNNTLKFIVPKGASSPHDHLEEDTLYMRAYVDLFDGNYEYVPVYLNITDKYLDKTKSDYDILTLTLKTEYTKDNSKGNDMNPITRSAIQFGKLHFNEMLTSDITDQCDPLDSIGPGEILKYSVKNLNLLNNYYVTRMNHNHGKVIDLHKSYARLNDPSGKKLGGGLRVSSIEIHDNWNEITDGSGRSTFYATDYEYTTEKDGLGGNTLSSGVASYEPGIGGDENPFKRPLNYADTIFMAPDNRYMMEEPIGEIHFPSANVVYSQVTQKSRRNDNDLPYATGRTVNNFYTAKDFPIRVRQTSLENMHTPTIGANQLKSLLLKKIPNNPLRKHSIDEVTVSQGYSIIKNDMHGKPRSTFIYAEGQTTPLSGVEYMYQTNSNGNLKNEFKVLNPDGTFSTETIGVDYDMYIDMRERKTSMFGAETSFNVDFNSFPPLLLMIPVPTFVSEKTAFNSSVFQKVIFQYGLVDSIRVFDGSSEILTTNVALDSENSNILLTKTHNEFGDPIYNTTYPAHWAYNGMGGAYKNIGADFIISTTSGGEVHSATLDMIDGDEIIFTSLNMKAWVSEFQTKLYLIDRDGNLILDLTNQDAKIIRSGFRNIASNPIAQTKTTDLPRIVTGFINNKVLDASAIEYTNKAYSARKLYPDENGGVDDGVVRGGCSLTLDGRVIVNPFIEGLKGNWKPKKEYVYLTNRKSYEDVDIRNGGVYLDFSSFWSAPNGQQTSFYASPSNKWIWTSEAKVINPNGLTISTVDPLDRHNSQLLGYEDNLIIASVFNSELCNSANINFEDFEINQNCFRNHIDLRREMNIVNHESHSGNSSLYLQGVNLSESIVCNLDQNSIISNQIPHILREQDLTPNFKPIPGLYLISAWVKVGNNDNPIEYNNVSIEIENLPHTSSQHKKIIHTEGSIVEGWQKIEGVFEVMPNAQDLRISFKKKFLQDRVYFDDFRIHPIDSNMKSYVYNVSDNILMAELDENNYGVFYEYNEEGGLIRTKRETERGIVTIQENRMHVQND